MPNQIRWNVIVAGDHGDDVWDNEFFVIADIFAEAVSKAQVLMLKDTCGDCDIVSIEQE